jgi:hypothetical protein
MNTSSFFSALSLNFATKHVVALHMPTVHSRARRHAITKKAQPFALSAGHFSPCAAQHGYATHLPDLPWPRLVASRRSKHRGRTPRATRARRHGEGEIPRDKRAPPRSSGQVLAPPPVVAAPALLLMMGGGEADEGADERNGTGAASHARPAGPPLPSPFDAFEAEPHLFFHSFGPLLRCLCALIYVLSHTNEALSLTTVCLWVGSSGLLATFFCVSC